MGGVALQTLEESLSRVVEPFTGIEVVSAEDERLSPSSRLEDQAAVRGDWIGGEAEADVRVIISSLGRATSSEVVGLTVEVMPLGFGSTAGFGDGEMSHTTSSRASTFCR